MLGVANLQEQAINRMQQSEQFWQNQEREEKQFVMNLAMSKWQFEKNYGVSLQELDLKKQGLELERQRNAISMAQYKLEASKLNKEKTFTRTEAIVAQDIKNKMASGQFTKEQFFDTNYLATVREMTGFDGSVEELSSIVTNAHNSVSASGGFNPAATGAEVTRQGGLLGQGGLLRDSAAINGLSTLSSIVGEGLLGTVPGQESAASQVDWAKFAKTLWR
jgi:hypothetical protein